MNRLSLEEKWDLDDQMYEELQEEPYFMTNKEWYYYDEQSNKYKLTDKATDEAIESYKNFYKR